MKIAVVGSRNLNTDISDFIPKNATEIISGGAKGIDNLAEKYAREHNIKMTVLYPEYEKYRKNAPLIRNRKIVEISDLIVAIWDGKSKGTKYSIDYAKEIKKEIRVIVIKNTENLKRV